MVKEAPVTDPEQLLLAHLPLVERAAAQACRRRRLGPEETEDFVSRVKIKLIEDDYAVIRKFEGKNGSKLSTYLLTVVGREFLDYLDHLYGKWRPSAAAKRLGRVAVELDRLLTREGYSFDEACQILGNRTGEELDWRELEEIAAELPPRARRRPEGEEALARLPAPERQPEERLLDAEREAVKRQMLRLLAEALKGLPDEDRLIVVMCCQCTVARTARALNLEQKPLYQRRDAIYRTLGGALAEKGFTKEDVEVALGGGGGA